MNTDRIITMLNDLITKNYDAERGYLKAAEETDNNVLSLFFRQKSSQRYQFGHEIKDLIRQLEGEIDKGGSVKGDLHRTWMGLKAALASNKEEMILEEVERGEEAFLKEYENFLAEKDLPLTVYETIDRQRQLVKRTLNRVEELEEVYDA